MKTQNEKQPQMSDDRLVFADEKQSDGLRENNASPWKIIIADDQIQVHTLTRMILDGYLFEGRGLDLISTFSGSETKEKLQAHPDTAVLLLDVVMETDDAGLEVARYVREDLGNPNMQIIIRTGQAGRISENRVVAEYAVNKFVEKTELTAQKIITLIATSLQTYRDIERQGRESPGTEAQDRGSGDSRPGASSGKQTTLPCYFPDSGGDAAGGHGGRGPG